MDIYAPSSETGSGFGLTEPEVRRLQDILRRQGNPDVTIEDAWVRAVELIAVFRMLIGPLPEDQDGSLNQARFEHSPH